MSIPDPIVLLDARARYVHPALEMSRASTKTVFDATGRLVTVPPNALGWDHDPSSGAALGLSLEPPGTNLALYSDDYSHASWTKHNVTVSADAITGPDGLGMAKVIESSEDGFHYLRQAIAINAGAEVCLSAIFKPAERSRVSLFVRNSTLDSENYRAVFDLVTGEISSAASSGDASLLDSGVVPLAGGFFRAWISGRLSAGATEANLDLRVLDDSGTGSYTGDGTSGLYLARVQAEEAPQRAVLSAPSSPIATTSAAATRAESRLTLASVPAHQFWRRDSGTVIVDFIHRQKVGNAVFLAMGLGATSYWLYLRQGGDGTTVILHNSELNEFTTVVGASRFLPRKRFIIAVTWSATGFSACGNGGPVVAGSINQLPSGSLQIGWYAGSWTSAPQAAMRRLIYIPGEVPNAMLQSLTAIQEPA